jgi:hypothetical protein
MKMDTKLCKSCLYKQSIVYNNEQGDNGSSITDFNPSHYEKYEDMKRAFIKFKDTCTDYFALTKKGYTYLHLMSWFISYPCYKLKNQSRSALMFFKCLSECLDKDLFYKMLIQGTNENKTWTVLHCVYETCQNIYKTDICELVKILLRAGLSLDMPDDNGNTPNMIYQKKNNKVIKTKVNIYTKKYKSAENIFIKYMIKDYKNNFNICERCGNLVSYLYDLDNFGKYLKSNDDKNFLLKYGKLINNIIINRKMVTDTYKESDLNNEKQINQSTISHEYVTNLYENLL